MDIGQHPHIGLSTLTYLFEGELMHRDSMGTEQLIKPGSVNLMTAGEWVVHTERTPKHLRDGQTYTMHGYQIWIALPEHLQEMRPEFKHCSATDLPRWQEGGIDHTLVAGSAFGKTAPIKGYSALFMVEMQSHADQAVFDATTNLQGEIGIVIVAGWIEACGDRIEQGNMLVSNQEDICKLLLGPNTHLLLFGGPPFGESRHIYWNFVSTDQEKIEAAKQKWQEKDFTNAPGEHDYIPMPGS